jgi:hypothetical protein
MFHLDFQFGQKLGWQLIELGFRVNDQQPDAAIQHIEINDPRTAALAHPCPAPSHLSATARAGNHITRQRIGGDLLDEFETFAFRPDGRGVTLKNFGFGNGVRG